MKTKKRRLEYYSFYNHTGIERHLTEMAQKGWLLESISNFYWIMLGSSKTTLPRLTVLPSV